MLDSGTFHFRFSGVEECHLSLHAQEVISYQSARCAQVWNNLTVMAEKRPIEGNMGGSALTMFSSPGLVFGVLQVSIPTCPSPDLDS